MTYRYLRDEHRIKNATPVEQAANDLIRKHLAPRDRVVDAAEALLAKLDAWQDGYAEQLTLITALRDLAIFKQTEE